MNEQNGKYITNFEEFDKKYAYYGDDLGVRTEGDITRFKVWAPYCTAAYLNLYTGGEGDNKVETVCMRPIENGVWYVELMHTVYGMYYTYTLEFDHTRTVETIDIYAKGCGVNGERGYIPDFEALNPDGWHDVPNPVCESPVDAVIYECHVRDFSVDPSSGVYWENRGRFMGFTDSDTKCGEVTTCLSHLKELGVTHVQLLPVADYATVNEKKPWAGQYNWGYDPKNYMCLEGYYTSNPDEAEVRIREFKHTVMALHRAGIGVIMDVVFNHTYFTEQSAFHKTVPYYYHRLDSHNRFSNGSGCGNETASNHAMMRKYILDALKFYVTEYKVDGFRFDLMGIHDIDTINYIRDELNKINPQILMYGEGWTGGECAYPTDKLCYKWNSYSFGRVGLFNDNLRDGIKGGTFDLHARGYISGNDNAFNSIKRGVTANTRYQRLQGTMDDLCWAFSPEQTINYCEAHDNHTLWDKLSISISDSSEDDRRRMDKLAAAIVILSQGTPFLQLGQDFLRTKPAVLKDGEQRTDTNIYEGNSYNSPDSVNAIKWSDKQKNYDVFCAYRDLIAIRKSSWLFRMRTCEDLDKHLYFRDGCDIVAFELVDDNESFVILFNHRKEERSVSLPNGEYECVYGDEKGTRCSGQAKAARISCSVYKRI